MPTVDCKIGGHWGVGCRVWGLGLRGGREKCENGREKNKMVTLFATWCSSQLLAFFCRLRKHLLCFQRPQLVYALSMFLWDISRYTEFNLLRHMPVRFAISSCIRHQ